MPALKALDKPLPVQVVDGEVVVLGDGKLDFSLTPDAAIATAEAMRRAAEEALSAAGEASPSS